MKKILAFDIGGTKVAYAVVDENGNLIKNVTKVATPDTAEGIYALFKHITEEFATEIDGVSIATAGAINNENNKIISRVGNLPDGYNQLDFTKLTDKPVLLENDANSAAWAEYKLGAAKGTKHAVVISIGTGVGAGIIVDGKLLKGKSGSAGEMHVRCGFEHKRKCTCGLWDCLEAYASGTALSKDAVIFMGEGKNSYDVIRGLSEGDAKAKEAFDFWQEAIENTLVMIGNLFDPEVIVLAGSMAEFVEYDKLNKQANNDILTQPFVLKRTAFDNSAAMIGAALLLVEKLEK